MNFPDLGEETQIASAPFVRAVGWLTLREPFPTGSLPPRVTARLNGFAQSWTDSVDALGWPVAAGAHCCDLCGRFHASGNFGVPGGELLYVCPEMVAHYVTHHGYRPPEAFVDALLACPIPGTPAYAEAVTPFRLHFERLNSAPDPRG